MSQASRSAGQPGHEPATTAQLQAAEERGARAVRERLREVLETERRVVRVGASQVEVVQAEALEELLEPGEG